MNRRGFLTALAGGAAAFTLAACDNNGTSSTGSDEPDCDADDLVEGDSDCGGKGAKPKTKPKPTKTKTKSKTDTKTKGKTGSRSGGRR